MPFSEERKYLPLVPLDEIRIGLLIPVGAAVFHAILLRITLDLSVTEHRQAGHCGHDCADTEILVVFSELINRCPFVGVVHEVDESSQNFRIKFESVLDDRPVAAVFLVSEHIHESAVVDPVHPEGPDKKPFEEPERLCKEEGVRCFGGDPVNDFAPELPGHGIVERIP